MANRTVGSSALKDDFFEGKIVDNVVNIDDFRNPVEKKISDISRQTRDILEGTEDFEANVKEKIKAIITENEVKTKREEINDLAESMAREIGIGNQTDIKVEAKKIRLEIEKWEEKNPGQIKNFRKEEFKKKLIEETKKINPDIKQEELNKVREYGEMVSDVYADESVVDKQKDEALEANSGYGPGKLENSWTDLRGITNFLTKKPNEVKDVKNRYESVKSDLKDVKIPNTKEGRSFENLVSIFNNQNASGLFSRTQGYLGWFDKVNNLTGGWLNKTMGRVGGQVTGEFAKNSLGVLAEQGFKQGFSSILKGILGGGVKTAATTAGSAAATGAAVAGGAALSATGIGAIVVAAAAILKKIKDVFGKLAEKLGISSKKFLEENFGKGGAVLIEGAGFLIGLPLLLVGAISAAVVTPILLIVFGGLFGYQMFLGNSVSSLVPPKGATSLSSISTSGGNTTVSGQVGTIVNGLEYSGTTILNTKLTNINISKSVIGSDVYYGSSILPSMTTNAVIADQVIELLKKISTYISGNSYVTNKSILTAGMYSPGGSISYPHEYALGIDLFNQWTYSYNGTTYYPYSSYADSTNYRKFICEVCNGDETCPQNINYHIYEEIFRPAGWCWGGYWGEGNFDPMHYEVLRPWASSCSTGNKVQITCN